MEYVDAVSQECDKHLAAIYRQALQEKYTACQGGSAVCPCFSSMTKCQPSDTQKNIGDASDFFSHAATPP